MSLLMDALKKADKAKETHNQNDSNDPTPEWTDQLIEWNDEPQTPIESKSETILTAEESIPETVDPGELSDTHTINWEEDLLPEFREDALVTEHLGANEGEEIESITQFNWEEELLTDFKTDTSEYETHTTDELPDSAAETPLVEKKKTEDAQTAEIHQLPYTASAANVQTPAEETVKHTPQSPPQATEQAKIIAFQTDSSPDTPTPEDEEHAFEAETAQRFLSASAPPSRPKQKLWLYSVLLLVLVAGLGGGGYYYYTLTQPSLFLGNPSAQGRSFSQLRTVETQPKVTPAATTPKTAASQPTEPNAHSVAPTPPNSVADSTAPTSESLSPPVTAEAPVADSTESSTAETTVANNASEEKEPKDPTTSEPLKVVNPATSKTQVASSTTSTPKTPETALAPTPEAAEEKSTPETEKVKKPTVEKPETLATQQLPSLHKNVSSQFNQHLSQAYAAFKQGNDTAAQQAYQQVLTQDRNNRDALLGLAAIALRHGQAETARHYYRKLLQLYPEDPLAQVGIISTLKTQSLENESQLKLILQQMPESAYVHFNLGNVYASRQQWAQAQQAYFNAYRYDNQNADYAYNLAISLDQLNQPGAALSYYQQALHLSQRQPVHFNPHKLRQRIQTLRAHHRASALTDLTTID